MKKHCCFPFWNWGFFGSFLVFNLALPFFAMVRFVCHQTSLQSFWQLACQPAAANAYSVTLLAAGGAAVCNTFFGSLVAWVLVRYNFPGRRLVDAAVDLPFSLQTSVAGLTLATVFGEKGWIGSWLSKLGVDVVFTRLGVFVAMVFVSFPFVVRTLQPVLEKLEMDVEEAAWCLGGTSWETFRNILFPPLMPAILNGMALAFSRAVGEYGSVVMVSSNIPYQDLVASVLIFQKLEQYDKAGATAIGTVMVIISLAVLFSLNLLQYWKQKTNRKHLTLSFCRSFFWNCLFLMVFDLSFCRSCR